MTFFFCVSRTPHTRAPHDQIINRLRQECKFDLVALTQDWHPLNHVSFYENNKNNPEAKLFSECHIPGVGAQVQSGLCFTNRTDRSGMCMCMFSHARAQPLTALHCCAFSPAR